MSTPHERRRIMALLVEDASLATLSDALSALSPAIEVRAPDALLSDASAAPLFGGEEALVEMALSLAAGVFSECRARVAVADGIWPALALARRSSLSPVSETLERVRALAAREARTHPRGLAKQVSRSLRGAPAEAQASAQGSRASAQLSLAGLEAPVVTPPGENARALSSLPLSTLELPEPVMARLHTLGLSRVGALAELPIESLTARFGAMGERAVKLARGVDPTPLTPRAPEEKPRESIELEGGVESLEPLVFVLKTLAERLSARLAGRVLGATKLHLIATESSREETCVPIVLATPSSSTSAWLPVLREMLGTLRLPTPIVRLSLVAEELTRLGAEQLALDEHPERTLALETVLSRLESRLGPMSVLEAELADTHRPEAAYVLRRYEARATRALPPERAEEQSRPTRLLPTPLRIDVDARWSTARVHGVTHAIEHRERLERLSGEWWSEPYQRDYHRVRLRGLGDVWIFFSRGQAYLHGWFD